MKKLYSIALARPGTILPVVREITRIKIYLLLTYHAFITNNRIRTTNNRPPPPILRPIISSEMKTSTLSFKN
jgi:hypothetical protein